MAPADSSGPHGHEGDDAVDEGKRDELAAGAAPKKRRRRHESTDAGLLTVVSSFDERVINEDFMPYINAVAHHVRVGERADA